MRAFFISDAHKDERVLVVKARFSWGWNLLDFWIYLIEYLHTNELPIAYDGIELGELQDCNCLQKKTLTKDDDKIEPFDGRTWQNIFRIAPPLRSHLHLCHCQQRIRYATHNPIVTSSKV